jgi:catechol 2,3-dioxygenase-like lactoylglutathione lyase family enzyme
MRPLNGSYRDSQGRPLVADRGLPSASRARASNSFPWARNALSTGRSAALRNATAGDVARDPNHRIPGDDRLDQAIGMVEGQVAARQRLRPGGASMVVCPSLPTEEVSCMSDVSDFRVARPSNDLGALRRFYIAGLGLEVLAEFAGHDGFDGLVLRVPGSRTQIEFTVAHGHAAPRAPTMDHLIALYMPDSAAYRAAVARMRAAGFAPVPSFNPYWDVHGSTFEDPDGYRVVLVNGAYPPTAGA